MNVADLAPGETRFDSLLSDILRQLARHVVANLPRQSLCRGISVPEMSLLVNMVRLLEARGVFVLNL